MDCRESTLLLGALRSARAVLVYGTVSSRDELAACAAGLAKAAPEIWVLPATADLAALRSGLRERLVAVNVVVLSCARDCVLPLRELVAEFGAGELRFADGTNYQVAPEARCVALVTDGVPSEALRNAFPLHVVGMRILDEARAAREREARELEAARARARQSSIDHGLV